MTTYVGYLQLTCMMCMNKNGDEDGKRTGGQ